MDEQKKIYQAFGKTYHIPPITHDQYVAVTDLLRGKDTMKLDRETSLKVLATVLIPDGREWSPEICNEQLQEFHKIPMSVEVEALKDFFPGYVILIHGMLNVLEILEMQNELQKMNFPKLLEQLRSLKEKSQLPISQDSSTD